MTTATSVSFDYDTSLATRHLAGLVANAMHVKETNGDARRATAAPPVNVHSHDAVTRLMLQTAEEVKAPAVAVVMVNYRTPELTKRCIAAVAKEREKVPLLRAVVVDGGSGDESAAELGEALGASQFRRLGRVPTAPDQWRLRLGEQSGDSNARATGESTEFVHVLNPDTEVRPGAITALIEELQANPDCGAAGSLLIGPDGHPAACAFRFPLRDGNSFRPLSPMRLAACSASARLS